MMCRTLGRVVGLAMLAAMGSQLVGCNVVGWGAQVFSKDEHALVSVTAEYRGLDNQSVAVLVDADPSMMYEFPTAQLEVCAAVTQQITGNVPGVKATDPRQVVDFQQRNIHWNTATYSNLAKRLGVSRIVLVELTEYRVNEPGNVHMFRGVMSCHVSVAETDGPHPNDLAYRQQVNVTYPPGRPEGVPDADPLTIRKATLDLFSLMIGGKFFDHKEPQM